MNKHFASDCDIHFFPWLVPFGSEAKMGNRDEYSDFFFTAALNKSFLHLKIFFIQLSKVVAYSTFDSWATDLLGIYGLNPS